MQNYKKNLVFLCPLSKDGHFLRLSHWSGSTNEEEAIDPQYLIKSPIQGYAPGRPTYYPFIYTGSSLIATGESKDLLKTLDLFEHEFDLYDTGGNCIAINLEIRSSHGIYAAALIA